MRRNEQAGISYEIDGEELVSWPLYVKNGQMILWHSGYFSAQKVILPFIF